MRWKNRPPAGVPEEKRRNPPARKGNKRSGELKCFSQRLAEHFGDGFLAKNPFQSWDAFFEYLAQKSNERLTVVIDEFPYLVEANPSLPSILQEYWDLKLSKGRIFLVICGSSVSMMEKLLGYKSPLYGRRTAQLRVSPLGFFEARGSRYREPEKQEGALLHS